MVRDSNWWSRQKLTDISSYTLSKRPPWLQESMQNLFRNLMVERIKDFTRSARTCRPLGTVVDLACGPGDWTLKYLDFSEHAVGIDICRDFIDTAQRAALAHGQPEHADFICLNLLEFEEYSDVGLVCLGGLLQCMNDAEVAKLFAVLARELEPGTCVYVRTNVAHSFVGSYQTANGCYRSRKDYENRFRQCGLEVFDSFTSSSVIPAKIASELSGIRSFQTARRLGLPLWLLHRLKQILFAKSDHRNWFLVKT